MGCTPGMGMNGSPDTIISPVCSSCWYKKFVCRNFSQGVQILLVFCLTGNVIINGRQRAIHVCHTVENPKIYVCKYCVCFFNLQVTGSHKDSQRYDWKKELFYI